MSEEQKDLGAVPVETAEDEKSKREARLEMLVAIFLGITALLTAWATWIGSLHGGNQATNYAESNNYAAEGNAEYNQATQMLLSDLMAWNTMMEYSFDKILAEAEGDTVEADLIAQKLDNFAKDNFSQVVIDAVGQMDENMRTPFEVEGVTESYFVKANELLEQSRALLVQGQQDNANGDKYNLVTVIYSLVLFLLGIVGIFKRIPNRFIVLIVAIVLLIIATIYMCTIPMPTGFSLGNFF